MPALVALGVYIVVHGQITPGGGFQGGVILAAGPLVVFLSGRYLRMRRSRPHTLVEVGDAVGAAGFALVGLGGLVFVGVFFKNFLPFGIPGTCCRPGRSTWPAWPSASRSAARSWSPGASSSTRRS